MFQSPLREILPCVKCGGLTPWWMENHWPKTCSWSSQPFGERTCQKLDGLTVHFWAFEWTLFGERGNALTTSAPKIGRGSYLLVAPLGTFKSKTLTLPHRSSIVSPQNDAQRSWEVFFILPMWARSNTCMSYARSQSNFGSWDILHVKHFWRCIVSAVCVANQETSWIAAGAGARRAKTLSVLKGLFLHLSRHGHGMPHMCVFDLLILCRPALMLNGGRVDTPKLGWLDQTWRTWKKNPKWSKMSFEFIWFFDMASSSPADLLGVEANFNMIGLRNLETVLAASQRPRATLWSTRTRECNLESAWTYTIYTFLHMFLNCLIHFDTHESIISPMPYQSK